jgi:hypothetical protein
MSGLPNKAARGPGTWREFQLILKQPAVEDWEWIRGLVEAHRIILQEIVDKSPGSWASNHARSALSQLPDGK